MSELLSQGKAIASATAKTLGGSYRINHNNPQTYGWTVYQGDPSGRNSDRACGGFVWLGQWVHIYGMAEVDIDFVKDAIDKAIESLEVRL